jgi:predicted transcriptional regulator
MAQSETLEMAAEVVAAFVSNNPLPKGELPALIQTIHDALTRLSVGVEDAAPKEEPKQPAVSIRKSITPDYLICLEDGKKFKSLKRHLGTLGLTPDQYRAKWNLPADYPVVAPNYAATRSALAKAIGLGQMGAKAGGRKRGRPPKAVQA